jgi:hypothetical protein
MQLKQLYDIVELIDKYVSKILLYNIWTHILNNRYVSLWNLLHRWKFYWLNEYFMHTEEVVLTVELILSYLVHVLIID